MIQFKTATTHESTETKFGTSFTTRKHNSKFRRGQKFPRVNIKKISGNFGSILSDWLRKVGNFGCLSLWFIINSEIL